MENLCIVPINNHSTQMWEKKGYDNLVDDHHKSKNEPCRSSLSSMNYQPILNNFYELVSASSVTDMNV